MRAVLLKNEELSKIKSELVKRICKFGPILQKEKAPGAEASGAFIKSKGPRWWPGVFQGEVYECKANRYRILRYPGEVRTSGQCVTSNERSMILWVILRFYYSTPRACCVV